MSTQPYVSTALARPIDHFVEMGREAMRSSKSERTRDAYSSDWQLFSAWCIDNCEVPLPARVETVVAYLGYMASCGRKVSTMGRHLVSIGLAHKAAGLETSPTASTPVKEALKGFRRILGVKRTKKSAVRRDDLQRMFANEVLSGGNVDHPGAIRDKAILLLGFSGAFRRSELVALDVTDLEFVPEGVTVTVRRSKTDQEGVGRRVAIHRGSELCPVRALEAWLETAGIVSGPVFVCVHWRGAISSRRITGEMVSRIVKRGAASIGKDPRQFGAHSLRRGFCTAGAVAGMSEVQLMRVTGHKNSKMLSEYVQEATLFEDNTSVRLGL